VPAVNAPLVGGLFILQQGTPDRAVRKQVPRHEKNNSFRFETKIGLFSRGKLRFKKFFKTSQALALLSLYRNFVNVV
jgi:hypothetical protein